MNGDRWSQLANVGVTVNLVLLVEDDADSANATKLILEHHGMSVKIAKDGGLAQSFFVMQKPDFVSKRRSPKLLNLSYKLWILVLRA